MPDREDGGHFPLRAGLLSFRETPVLVPVLESLTLRPDVLLVDGQGIAHPRRFGIACHLGLLFDIPTIGCAKSRLTGKFEEPGRAKGSHTELKDGEEVIGAAAEDEGRDQAHIRIHRTQG